MERDKRNRLRGEALRARTYHELAEMLRLLSLDLFDKDLGPPEDRFTTIITPVPELEVRENPRKHLEYVINQYGLNPQPRVTLFVEGESEVAFVETAFERLFGYHHGVCGLEIVNLKGVDNAAGSGRKDRFGAIFLLVDYLHDHQVPSFLVLDREGRAMDLKRAAQKRKSLYGYRKFAIPAGRIKVWQRNFEFDNFSDTELANALSKCTDGRVHFSSRDVKDVRERWPKSNLSELFKGRADRGLNKPQLARILAEVVVSPATRRSVDSRPIVKLLVRVVEFASQNHPPIFKSTWERNQPYMDKTRIVLR